LAEQTRLLAVTDSQSVTAIVTEPEQPSIGWQLIYAPGAGSNAQDPFGRFLCRELAVKGVLCAHFQFPYQEAGRRSPDRTAVLAETWRGIIRELREPPLRLVVGGRSMGGRIVSQVVAQGEAVDALALFAYPLHAPGKPEQRRVEHLPAIRIPTLFCSGTRDVFASPEELREAAAFISASQVHLLQGADHGFNVPKSSGRAREDVWREAADTAWEWLQGVM
jgi:predicted alpha/beta-hydrolase family hydrolase